MASETGGIGDFATGATHAPHHAPKEWIAKYKGEFSGGWDKLREDTFARQKKLGVIPADAKLTPRPKEIPAWSDMSADQKRLFERQMETFAGFAEHTDHQVGRLVAQLEAIGALDNTISTTSWVTTVPALKADRKALTTR